MRGSIVLLVILVPSVSSARGIRCKDQLVPAGASAAEVAAKCGEPTHIDTTWEVRTVRRYHPPYGHVEQHVTMEIQRWTYIPGPNRLVRTAVFKDGRLETVRTEGRPPRRASNIESCRRAIHSTGDTTGEVMLRCGVPDQEDRWEEEFAEGGPHLERRIRIPYARWVYNFGPKRFIRILTFRRGRLVSQRSGPRGWAIEEPAVGEL